MVSDGSDGNDFWSISQSSLLTGVFTRINTLRFVSLASGVTSLIFVLSRRNSSRLVKLANGVTSRTCVLLRYKHSRVVRVCQWCHITNLRVVEVQQPEFGEVGQRRHIADLRTMKENHDDICEIVDSNEVTQPFRFGRLPISDGLTFTIQFKVISNEASIQLHNPLDRVTLLIRSMDKPAQPNAADCH